MYFTFVLLKTKCWVLTLGIFWTYIVLMLLPKLLATQFIFHYKSSGMFVHVKLCHLLYV
jgi:hypothetical protein